MPQQVDAAGAAVSDMSSTGGIGGEVAAGSAAAVADVTAAAATTATVVPPRPEPHREHPVTACNGTSHSSDMFLGRELPDAVGSLSRTWMLEDQQPQLVDGLEQHQGKMAGVRRQAHQEQDSLDHCQLPGQDTPTAAAEEEEGDQPSVVHINDDDAEAALHLLKRFRQPSKRYEDALKQEKLYCRELEAADVDRHPHLGFSKGVPTSAVSLQPELKKRRKFVVSSKVPQQDLCANGSSGAVDEHGNLVQQPPQQHGSGAELRLDLQQQHKAVSEAEEGRSSKRVRRLPDLPPMAALADDGVGAASWSVGARSGTESCGLVAAGNGSSSGTGRSKNKGGRPKGSGNRTQMAPRAVGGSGQPGFALRSDRFTGVYQSKRSKDGWRAQFCYSNKVLNLGTYGSEDDAARAWNAAAVYFRGEGTWINPVEPPLPASYQPGTLQGSPSAGKAGSAREAILVLGISISAMRPSIRTHNEL
eukprot:gene10534-10694_t